jgi:hypothetical protein
MKQPRFVATVIEFGGRASLVASRLELPDQG